MARFREGKIPEQKLQDGRMFPKVILPSHHSQKEEVGVVLQTIREERQWLERELHDCGALLFRGFAIRSPSDFNDFVESFGWEEQPYKGLAPRNNIVGRVYTANEAPLDQPIFFHHEMALEKEFPSKLLFFCEIPPTDGGQTAVVLSHRVAEQIGNKFPDIVEKLDREGILTCIPVLNEDNAGHILGKSWQSFLKTNDPLEAEKRIAASGDKIHWMADGSAKIVRGPLPARRMFEGYDGMVWFNYIPAAMFKPSASTLSCGNGSAIPDTIVEECINVMNDECVELKWEVGDVLLIDNLAVMHARRPCKPPRLVLVAMCK